MTYEPRVCRQCQNEYIPFRGNQGFCSVKCRIEWWDWHWKHDEHKCPACGTVHVPVVMEEELIDA